MSVSELPGQVNNNNNNNMEKMFTVSNTKERRLLGGLFVSLLGLFIRITMETHILVGYFDFIWRAQKYVRRILNVSLSSLARSILNLTIKDLDSITLN